MRNWIRVALLVLVLPGMAQAAVLKFDDPTGPGGTVAWPGAGPITGIDIQFQSILGLETPLNAGIVLECVGCLLQFTTGAATAAGTQAGGFLITADPGGSMALTGAIPALGLSAGTTLLTGTFTGNPRELIGPGQAIGLFLGLGQDEKDPTLLAFYGLDPGAFVIGTTSIQSLVGSVDALTGAFTGAVGNADLNNAAVVPNPLSLVLLGLGMGGLGFMATLRRRHA